MMAFETQCQQALFEGHVHALDWFSGVFTTIRYDNLAAAAKKTLKGRSRVENERFTALRSHYLYESWFTLVGIEGAHEKGGVEARPEGPFRRAAPARRPALAPDQVSVSNPLRPPIGDLQLPDRSARGSCFDVGAVLRDGAVGAPGSIGVLICRRMWPRSWPRSGFEERLQSPKISHVGLAHRSSHDRRRDCSETRRLPPVAEGHPRRAVLHVLPGVRRLHGERAVQGCHDEAAPMFELPHFVCVLQRPAEELGAEPNLGTDDDRRSGVPLDRLDVLVPRRRVRRIGCEAETSSRGRLISISVITSTAMQEVCHSTVSRRCRTNVPGSGSRRVPPWACLGSGLARRRVPHARPAAPCLARARVRPTGGRVALPGVVRSGPPPAASGR